MTCDVNGGVAITRVLEYTPTKAAKSGAIIRSLNGAPGIVVSVSNGAPGIRMSQI